MSSTPILLQSAAATLTVYIETTAGVAATGLTYASFTAGLQKAGAAGFTSFALTGVNFVEISSGFYSVSLVAGDTNVLGNLNLRLLGATTRTALITAYVATAASIVPDSTTAPTSTTLFGFVYDLSASPVVGAPVTARILSIPDIIMSGSDGVAISFDSVTVKTDAQGYFSLSLITGTSVDIRIPAASYSRTLVVPEANTNLFSIA